MLERGSKIKDFNLAKIFGTPKKASLSRFFRKRNKTNLCLFPMSQHHSNLSVFWDLLHYEGFFWKNFLARFFLKKHRNTSLQQQNISI